MSTLQLKGDINWTFNDYAQEPSQIGTKQGTLPDFRSGVEIVLKMRLIAVERRGKKKKNRGSIKKDEIIGFAEQGVPVAVTILNYLIYSLC